MTPKPKSKNEKKCIKLNACSQSIFYLLSTRNYTNIISSSLFILQIHFKHINFRLQYITMFKSRCTCISLNMERCNKNCSGY